MKELSAIRITGETIKFDEKIIKELKERLGEKLILPWDESYDETRKLWNAMIDKKPALIVQCKGVADVVDSVNFARENNLLVAVRGGGHNVAGSASCDGGLMIDLSLMKGIWVDPKERTVRAQAGVTLGELDRETQVFELATPLGLVTATGISGLTLGGGLGWLSRKYGLTCDNLLSADIVTADGKYLTTSETENHDLFWGLHGGGGNFGVVTAFEYRLHSIGPEVMVCSVFYPGDIAKDAYRFYRDFTSKAPEELGSLAIFWTISDDPKFPTEFHGSPCVVFMACYLGSVEEGKRVIQPLREFAEPIVDFSSPMPFIKAQQLSEEDYPNGMYYYWKSIYLKNLSDEVIEEIIENTLERPSPLSSVDLWHLGGTMSRVKEEVSAIAMKDASYMVCIQSNWKNPQDSEKNVSWTRQFWEKLKKHSIKGGVYLNFPGFLEDSDKLMKSTFGPNYKRLVALKNKYDPNNLFRLNHNIKPTK
jgi:hypothetical protein